MCLSYLIIVYCIYIYISWFKIRLIVSTHHDLPFRSFHSTFWEASNLCRSCLDKTQTEELLSIKDPYLDANIWYSDHQWILAEIWLNHVKSRIHYRNDPFPGRVWETAGSAETYSQAKPEKEWTFLVAVADLVDVWIGKLPVRRSISTLAFPELWLQ